MFDLGYTVESTKPFDEVSTKLEEAIPANGFRVLAVHNVQETLKEKGFESSPMKIVELCNAKFAHEALGKDVNVSLLMPCKIVVRTENDKTIMTLARPSMISQMLPEAGLENLAGDVENVMKRIMDEVK
jgi:uncharacterized protein (DUF302 family)